MIDGIAKVSIKIRIRSNGQQTMLCNKKKKNQKQHSLNGYRNRQREGKKMILKLIEIKLRNSGTELVVKLDRFSAMMSFVK